MDGGSLLYTEPTVPEFLAGQEALKSDLIASIYSDTLRASAIGLGPYDLGAGPANVRPARHAANLPADSGIATSPPEVIDTRAGKIGVFGVVAPQALAPFGVTAGDPREAAASAVESLRQKGAQVVIGLAHMTRREATALARAVSGIDFLIIGQNAPEPAEVQSAAARVGDTYLLSPANRGQVVSRLDITLRGGGGPLTDAVGEARASAELAELAERIAVLTGDLAKWRDDPSADPDFVAGKESELGEMRARKQSLETTPLVIPEKGSFFTLGQIAIRKGLPCNLPIQDAKKKFDRAAGKGQRRGRQGRETAAPGPWQGTLRRRRGVLRLPRRRGRLLEEDQTRQRPGTPSTSSAKSSTTTASRATSPAGTSPADRLSPSTRPCATCNARRATAPGRSTPPRKVPTSRSP